MTTNLNPNSALDSSEANRRIKFITRKNDFKSEKALNFMTNSIAESGLKNAGLKKNTDKDLGKTNYMSIMQNEPL